MMNYKYLPRSVPLLLVLVFGQEYRPREFQHGKDVVWVPTPEDLVAAMLDMAEVMPEDYLIDLGSGDGRIVIAAAKRGTRALGVEYNPDLVALARRRAEKEGVTRKARFVEGDIFETDFRKATVLTMYLLTSINMKLRPRILEMEPGTRVVSHIFSMEDWEADEEVTVRDRFAYLWIVPAKVSGKWKWQTKSGQATLHINQKFQKINGSFQIGDFEVPFHDAELKGDRIRITVADDPMRVRIYEGRVRGDVITGTYKATAEAALPWSALRESSKF